MADMQAASEHACVPQEAAESCAILAALRTEAGLLEHSLSWAEVAPCSGCALSAAARSCLQLQGTQHMLQGGAC